MTVQNSWTLDNLVTAFVQHQRRTRGTKAHTLRRFTFDVREFLRTALGDDPIDPKRLQVSDVVEFISARAARHRPRTVKETATSLRWLFRFLRLEGLCDGRLDEAVPSVAGWRLSTLPRGLEEEDLARLLTSMDESTWNARRIPLRGTACGRPPGPRPSHALGLPPGQRFAFPTPPTVAFSNSMVLGSFFLGTPVPASAGHRNLGRSDLPGEPPGLIWVGYPHETARGLLNTCFIAFYAR